MNLDIKKLKLEMARNEFTSKELSKASNIPIATIYNYTSGKRNPSTKALGKISKALNVDVTKLIEE